MSFLTTLGEYLYGPIDQPAFSEEELNLMRQGINPATLPEEEYNLELLAGLGLGGGFYADQIAKNTAARQGFQLVGSPQTTSSYPRLTGGTAPQYTGPTPGRMTPGTQLVPTGQAPAVRSVGGAPAIKPAQVTSISTIAPKVSSLSRAAGPVGLYSLADLGVKSLTGKGISERVGEGLGGAIGSLIYGDTSQPAFTQEELDQMQTYEQAQGLPPIQLEALERLSPQSVSNLIGFKPAYEGQKLADYMNYNDDPNTPTEQFLDPQGRLRRRYVEGKALTPQYSEYEKQVYLSDLGLAARDRLPGESQTDRDTRIAQSRTRGSTRGGPSMAGEMSRSEAIRIAKAQGYEGKQAGDVADGYIALQRQGRDFITGQPIFQPREVEIGGNKYIQLTPNYFQPIKEDTPEKTGLQSSLDDLQADFEAGRLTKEEFDLAVKNITNIYIGRDKEKTKGDVSSFVEQAISNAGGGTSPVQEFFSVEEAEAANLPPGTKVIINGRTATVQ